MAHYGSSRVARRRTANENSARHVEEGRPQIDHLRSSGRGNGGREPDLEITPVADGRIAPWRASADRFFVFVFEDESGRIGSVSAQHLDILLSKIEELFDTHLLPPANLAFDIYVAAPDNKAIHDHAAKLLLATVAALTAGVRP